jgi:hypothetical protein
MINQFIDINSIWFDFDFQLIYFNDRNANEQRVPLYSIHSNMVFSPLNFAISGRDPFVRVYDRRFLVTNLFMISYIINTNILFIIKVWQSNCESGIISMSREIEANKA